MTRLINNDGRDVTAETLAALKAAMGGGQGLEKAATINTSTGLIAYDLEAPAKNLYPVLTPLRNRIPRKTRGAGAGDGAHWKEVSAITGGGISSMPWVAEGQRAARMALTTADRSASYVTLGEEADVTFEAQSAGEGFEDVLASTGVRLLQALMIKEEFAILGGNRSVALGTPTAPTVLAVDGGGSIADDTYSCRVVALTLEGYLAASVANGLKQAVVVTGMDGKTYTLNGGSSQKSNATSSGALANGGDSSLRLNTPAIKGAVAYAWFVGPAAGDVVLQAITTINSVELTSLETTTQNVTAITADCSRNEAMAFDGLLYSAFKSSLAYYKSMATGTPGVGTGLTASGRGSVVEIDEMLEAFWSNYRLSPDEIYVNAQELRNLSTLALSTSGGASLIQIVQPGGGSPDNQPVMIAGNVVGYYFNPFSLQGGQMIPIKLHPNLPAGTLLSWCQNLPGYYQSANVPETAGIQCRRDYYQVPWPLVTRANETGVYCEEVLKCYAPFALGTICNIGDNV